MTVKANPEHPCKFSVEVLAAFVRLIENEQDELGHGVKVLDPFAGVGRIHQLRNYGATTTGIEIEPEWAACSKWTKVGDATDLPFKDGSFDCVMTSPVYPTRMCDYFEATDMNGRKSYEFALGRRASEGSAVIAARSTESYYALHKRAIAEMIRVTVPGGLVVVNVSNHQRQWKIVYTVDWFISEMLSQGLHLEQVAPVRTRRYRFGANREARVPTEHIIVCRKHAELERFEPRPPIIRRA